MQNGRHLKIKTTKAFLTELEEGEMNKPAKPNLTPPPPPPPQLCRMTAILENENKTSNTVRLAKLSKPNRLPRAWCMKKTIKVRVCCSSLDKKK
jgi:hypothetical protein